MHHFCPANKPTHQVLQGQILTPLFLLIRVRFDLNPIREQKIGEIRTKTRISTPMLPFWQGNGTNPAPHSHPCPQSLYFYAEVFHMLFITSLKHSVLYHLPEPLIVKHEFYAEVFHMFFTTSLDH